MVRSEIVHDPSGPPYLLPRARRARNRSTADKASLAKMATGNGRSRGRFLRWSDRRSFMIRAAHHISCQGREGQETEARRTRQASQKWLREMVAAEAGS